MVYFDSHRIGRESGGVRDYNWYGINGGTKRSGNGNHRGNKAWDSLDDETTAIMVRDAGMLG